MKPSLIKSALALAVMAFVVAACSGGSGPKGIATLGSDFLRAFNQGPNDTPLDASALKLTLTPTIEPFDP